MVTVTPRPSRSERHGAVLPIAATTVAVLVAVALGLLVLRSPAADRSDTPALRAPSGHELALTERLTLPVVDGANVVVDTPRLDKTSTGGTPYLQASGHLRLDDGLLWLAVTDFGATDEDALAAVEDVVADESMRVFDCTAPVEVRVAGTTGAYSRCSLANNRVLDEYRLVHDGRLYGFGYIGPRDDPVVSDTALAVLHSWRWTDA